MARFFKDMFNKNRGFIGDLADESWSSVLPLSAPTPPRDPWIQILKSVGEHLTDEELLIVRQQLAS
jgi:hypothetical protein